MRFFASIVALTCATFITTPLFAEPFGIDFGEQPSKYGCIAVADRPGFYACKSVPKPHSAFESYIVKSTEELGICFIKAIGIDIQDSGYAIRSKSELETMREALTKKYGPVTKNIDMLLPGALWDDADEFLMAIRQQQRLYAYFWESPKDTTDIAQLALALQATDSTTAFIVLEYSGTDKDACDLELRDAEADAL